MGIAIICMVNYTAIDMEIEEKNHLENDFLNKYDNENIFRLNNELKATTDDDLKCLFNTSSKARRVNFLTLFFHNFYFILINSKLLKKGRWTIRVG